MSESLWGTVSKAFFMSKNNYGTHLYVLFHDLMPFISYSQQGWIWHRRICFNTPRTVTRGCWHAIKATVSIMIIHSLHQVPCSTARKNQRWLTGTRIMAYLLTAQNKKCLSVDLTLPMGGWVWPHETSTIWPCAMVPGGLRVNSLVHAQTLREKV